jgi:phytoene dehydrogenase-like protein
MTEVLRCDVAIAGAGLAGLVAGAVLAKQGRSVAIVDRAPQVGGRGGSTPYRGCWIDAGHRDGMDVTDLQIGWSLGQIAAREAGVEIPLRESGAGMRVHWLPDAPGKARAVLSGAWSARGLGSLARDVLGCPVERLPEFAQVLRRLAASTPGERAAAIETPLPTWLEVERVDASVRRAFLTLVSVIFCEHPERASVGRLMSFFGRGSGGPTLVTGYADHPEVGGMQGLMEPFADAIRARGGRFLHGFEPRRVRFDGARAVGLVAIDEHHFARELEARAVVLAMPLWQALPLLPSERVPRELAALAGRLEDEQGDALGIALGLRRLPRLRAADGSAGAVESHVGWNRLLVGEERRYWGGFHLPSLGSRRAAPEARHLLHAYVVRWLRRDERPSWEESRQRIERVRDYLRRFYADLDDCLEWEELQWVERPSCMAWYWAPMRRHDLRVPGCEQLYLASATIESDAGPVDVAADAGLRAARAVLGQGMAAM